MKIIKNSTVVILAALAASALMTGSNRSIIAETASHAGKPVNAEKRDLVVTRVFAAPVEQVWRGWTDPQQVMRWWGPTGFTSPFCKIDLREGGKFIFCMRAPKDFQGGQDMYTSGVYKKIVPMQLIEFTQGLSNKDGNRIDPSSIGMPADFPNEIQSALAFKRVGNQTELTCTEYGWTVGQMRDLSESGLKECLDKLAGALAKR